jgi:hypothetical protein
MSTGRKPSTAVGWFPLTVATESAILDMANSRQIALRTRLQHFYWLTECKPIGPATVALQRKKMVMIDPRDTLTDDEVAEVLSEHYGFVATEAGLTIPELDDHRQAAVGALQSGREGRAEGGRKRAAAAAREGGRFVSGALPEVNSRDF